MDIPLLVVLLVLPIAAAAVIVAVSVGRRRGRGEPPAPGAEPTHRLQSDTAAVQDAVVHPPAATPRVGSARERRAASAATHDER